MHDGCERKKEAKKLCDACHTVDGSNGLLRELRCAPLPLWWCLELSIPQICIEPNAATQDIICDQHN